MTNKLKGFHHYKGNNLTRFEKVERKVIELILSSKVPDSQREDSIIFELKHASGCTQIARILAPDLRNSVSSKKPENGLCFLI